MRWVVRLVLTVLAVSFTSAVSAREPGQCRFDGLWQNVPAHYTTAIERHSRWTTWSGLHQTRPPAGGIGGPVDIADQSISFSGARYTYEFADDCRVLRLRGAATIDFIRIDRSAR